jgi:hypothetical protein
MIVMPTLKWHNKLDPAIDQDLLNAYAMLEKFGIRISQTTVASAVGIDASEELEKSMKEFKSNKEKIVQTLGQEQAAEFLQVGQQAAQGAKPPGGPGAGAKPPGSSPKPPGGMDDASKPPGSAPETGGTSLNDSLEAPQGGGLPTGVE